MAELRANSLRVFVLFAGAVAYAWLVYVLHPVYSPSPAPAAWLGSFALAFCTLASYLTQKRTQALSSALLISGMSIGIACATVTSGEVHLAHLFVLPVSLAGVLFGRWITLVVAAAAVAITLAIGEARCGLPWLSADLLAPNGAIMIIAVGSILSERSLRQVVGWASSEYQRALRNEQVAREQTAQLRQALKSLDEATYRLERANVSLSYARQQADEARRLKQQFAQAISHELRTPLNIIVSFIELMAESPEHYGVPLPEVYVRDLSIVHRNARHLHGLVSDVLDLARIEAAQLSLLFEETDPAALVQEALTTMRSLVESRGLALHSWIEPALPALKLDPLRIRQVLFNLLNNAVRFTEQGSVTVRVCRQSEEVWFSVVDTGAGITAEDMPRIFRDFEQLGSRRERGSRDGVGLGLAISKAFVELHGGRIWAESLPGQGSTFTFALPVTEPEALRQPSGTQKVAGAEMPGCLAAESIALAVTRSPSAAGLLTRYIRSTRTVIARDLEHAQAAARLLLPQAVVLDTASIALAESDVQALAEAWQLPDALFITCPLPGEEPLRQLTGADGYLVKPVSREAVWDVLRQFGESVDRVLVIDDDRGFVHLLARILDNPLRRYDVTGAYSAHEGLQVLQEARPDLIILDLGLPDLDGRQVLQQVRTNMEWQSIPVVIVTGRDEDGDLQALKGGLSITRANGLRPGEIVRWIDKLVEVSQKPLARLGLGGSRGGPAR